MLGGMCCLYVGNIGIDMSGFSSAMSAMMMSPSFQAAMNPFLMSGNGGALLNQLLTQGQMLQNWANIPQLPSKALSQLWMLNNANKVSISTMFSSVEVAMLFRKPTNYDCFLHFTG